MLNSVLSSYIQDASVPAEKRQALASDLDNGSLSENDAVGIISQKYGSKYSGGQTTPDTTPKDQTQSQDFGSRLLNNLNPMNLVPNFVNQALAPAAKATVEAPGNFIKGTANAAAEGVGKIYNAGNEFGNAITGIGNEGQQLSPEERGLSVAKGFTGTAGGALQAIFSPAQGVAEAVPGGTAVTGAIGKGINTAGDLAAGLHSYLQGIDPNSEQGKTLTQAYETLAQTLAPKAAEGAAEGVAEGVAKVGEIPAVSNAIETAKGKLGQVAEQGKNALYNIGEQTANAGQTAANIVGKGGQALGNLGKQVIGQTAQTLTGLKPETMGQAITNPEEFGAAKQVGPEQARQNLLEPVKAPIDQKIADLSDTGKVYDSIRNNPTQATLPTNWITDKLSQWGLIPDENGNLKATTTSDIRNSADINPIQKLYDLWKGTDSLSGKEVLNLRQDLANLANYDSTGKTTAVKDFARETRSDLNNEVRPQIPGLQELDNKYSGLKDELEGIKSMIYDKSGELKDNAVASIYNLTKKGNEAKLARVQELVPDIADQVKIVQAIEDLNSPKGGKLGSMFKLGAEGGLLMHGQIIPAAAIAILTHPDVIVPLLQAYGRAAGYAKDFISNVTDNIKQGIKPTGEAAKFVQEAINKVKPTVIDYAQQLKDSTLKGGGSEGAQKEPRLTTAAFSR